MTTDWNKIKQLSTAQLQEIIAKAIGEAVATPLNCEITNINFDALDWAALTLRLYPKSQSEKLGLQS